jgi:hypothetical protein
VRFLHFVAVAAGMHVAIPVVARIAPEPTWLIPARSSGADRRLEIDIEDVLLDPRRPDDPERPRPTEVATNEVSRPRALEEIYPDRQPTPPTGPVEPQVVEPPEPSSTATPSAPPEEYGALPPGPGTGTGLPPGLGGAPVWAVPGVVPEAPRPAPAPTTIAPGPMVDRDIAGKLVRETMREKDRGLGLDLPGAGTIGSVIAEVVRGSATPDVAKATFEVRIAPGGKVASVRVVRSSAGNAGEWSGVASAVNARLSSREFTLPTAYAAGAIVMVEAVSKVQYPDGTAGGGATFQKGGPSGNLGGGLNFDTSNIGARPKRIVGTSVSARPAG